MKENHKLEKLRQYKETYYGKRKQQIITLIIINVITSIIQSIYCLVKNFWLMDNDFKFDTNLVIPFTASSLFAYSLYIFSFLLSIIANYISFFWVIRCEFIKARPNSRTITLPDNATQKESISDENKNEEIQNDYHKSDTFKNHLISFDDLILSNYE